jgi:uncharacterized lipoprotein YajG
VKISCFPNCTAGNANYKNHHLQGGQRQKKINHTENVSNMIPHSRSSSKRITLQHRNIVTIEPQQKLTQLIRNVIENYLIYIIFFCSFEGL